LALAFYDTIGLLCLDSWISRFTSPRTRRPPSQIQRSFMITAMSSIGRYYSQQRRNVSILTKASAMAFLALQLSSGLIPYLSVISANIL